MNTPQRTSSPAAPPKAAAAPLRPAPAQTQATFGPKAAAPPFFAAATRAAPVPAPPKPAAGMLPSLLPDAVREKIGEQAHRFRGFSLLTVLLGLNPISGHTVPRTAPALVYGVLALTPGGEQQYQQLAQSGALGRAGAWLTAEAERRQLSWARVRQLLRQVWADFSISSFLLHPIDTVTRLVAPFRRLAADVLGFAGAVAGRVVEVVFSAVLGERGAEVLGVLRRAGTLFGAILRDPLPFLQNLVQAGWQGFQRFLARGPQHLLAAAQDWLLGGLAKTGLHLPRQLDVAGVISLLLQVFHLTKDAILGRLRQRLVQAIGTENVARVQQVIEQLGGVAVALWQHGPAAAWQQISQQAGDLKVQALEMVQQQVMGVATRAVPVFLATLAVPGGAFVQAAKGIYSAVMLFVEKGRQIAQVGSALLHSVGLIAAGQLGPAAQAVETTLVRLLPVALGFLAKWLNLDGISSAIQTGLKKVQAPVEKAVNKVLDVVTDKAKALWAKLQAGAGKVVDKSKQAAAAVGSKVKQFFGVRTKFATRSGEKHSLYFKGSAGNIQLIIESTPTDIQQFLDDYRLHIGRFDRNSKAKSPANKAKKLALVTQIEQFLNKYAPYYNILKQAAIDSKEAGDAQQALLRLNTELSEKLANLLGDEDQDVIDKRLELVYRWEGLTGKYASMVGITNDQLTPDHQPNVATLRMALKLTSGPRKEPLYSTTGSMVQRLGEMGAGHGLNAYTIILHEYRHEVGRTFKRDGGKVAKAFRDRIQPILDNETDPVNHAQKNRVRVAEALREEAKADAKSIENVLKEDNNWRDLNNLNLDPAPANQDPKKILRDRITARILQGEQEIQNQPFDDLLQP